MSQYRFTRDMPFLKWKQGDEFNPKDYHPFSLETISTWLALGWIEVVEEEKLCGYACRCTLSKHFGVKPSVEEVFDVYGRYWYINDTGDVLLGLEDSVDEWKRRNKFLGIFKTFEEAESMRDKIKSLLKGE